MINQILFLFGIYIVGVLFGFLFKKQLPFAFFCLTGFLWGALFWVIGGMFFLIFSIPYTPVIMFGLLIGTVSVVSISYFGNRRIQLKRSELTYLLSILVALLFILILVSQYNFSVASNDSFDQIVLGRLIAYEGFTKAATQELASWGIFLPQLQSASVFLDSGYLYAAQPAFAFTFLITYFYLCQRILGHFFSDKRVGLALTFLTTVALFSTYFMIFQIFYIHNSIISAVYLFVAVSAFWLASIERKSAWMLFAMLALTGFSLARTEAPLFALIFLALAINLNHFTYRLRLVTILPYLISLMLWYLYLYKGMGEGTIILNPERTLVIIASLVAFGILVGLSGYKWAERFLLPILPVIMLGLILLVLAFMFIQKPEHMWVSLTALLRNLISSGRWGNTWLFLFVLAVIALCQPHFTNETLFIFSIPAFFGLLLAFAFMRNPYRVGWGDSANRMVTHILPIIFLYVLMKYGQGLSVKGVIFDERNS